MWRNTTKMTEQMLTYSSQWPRPDQWDTRCLVNSAYVNGWRDSRTEVLSKLEILRAITSHDPDAKSFVNLLIEQLTNVGEELMLKESAGPVGERSLLKNAPSNDQ
jgi:hypothetical protein